MTAPVVEASTAGLTSASSARAAQIAVSAQAMRDAVQMWPLLDPNRLTETWPGWLRAMILLTQKYHAQSSQVAAKFYTQARAKATTAQPPSNLIRLAPEPSEEWLSKAYGYSGPGMLSRDQIQPNTALTTTLGTTSRIVQDGGRTTTISTIHSDPVAVGWYRLTDGHPCAFCALLASRGIVYKSEKMADFQAHNHCACTAAPAFTHSQELPQVNQSAQDVYYDATRGLSGSRTLNNVMPAFRKAWAEHQAQN